jgi:deoxyribodipyrimidine photo-lyase
VFSELGEANNIVNELHWRDFYANITHYFPRVLLPPANSFQSKFDEVKWKYNPAQLSAWKEGRTGFPIVDAAMRELNTTGFMHNRCRMIVASFFAKDLFLDWHEGEKYFASKLVDYSPMQNSGGWQWTVGNGTDAQPYFRIFNPWTQQANYDPQCAYIKKWLPELKGLSAEDIHNWSKVSDAYIKKGIQYPRPIINHDEARKETLAIYSSTFKKVQSTDK